VEDIMEKLRMNIGYDRASHEAHFQAKVDKTSELGTFNIFRTVNVSGARASRDDTNAFDDCKLPSALFTKIKSSVSSSEKVLSEKESVVKHSDELGVVQQVLQTLVAANRVQYGAMIESHAVYCSAYEILATAADLQEEAVNGDLSAYRFLADVTPKLHQASHVKQMSESVNVGWSYIRHMLNRSPNPFLNLVLTCMTKKPRWVEWRLLRRNVQVVLAYSLTIESHAEEMTHISEEALRGQTGAAGTVEDILVSPMKDVMAQSRDCLSQSIMKQDPAIFRLYEHILFALLVVAQQAEILKELAAEGCMNEGDMENLMENVIEPSRIALERYTPSKHMLGNYIGMVLLIMLALTYFLGLLYLLVPTS
jgi:hypothetical protein